MVHWGQCRYWMLLNLQCLWLLEEEWMGWDYSELRQHKKSLVYINSKLEVRTNLFYLLLVLSPPVIHPNLCCPCILP